MNAELYTMALDALANTIPGIAERKNVALNQEESQLLAGIVLDKFHPREVRDLAHVQPNAVALAVNSISRALDVLTLCRELESRVQRSGEPALDWARAWPAVEQVIDAFIANDAVPVMLGWPSAGEFAAYEAGIRSAVVLKVMSGTAVTLGHHHMAAPSPDGDVR